MMFLLSSLWRRNKDFRDRQRSDIMTKEYDLVVLGGGPGGYVSAIRAAQLGMQVAIVERSKLGGTCLHQGCIPSKSLLRSAEVFKQTQNADLYGVDIENVSLNFTKVHERKNSIIQTLHTGVQSLMTKGNIDIYKGFGRILGPSIFSPLPGTISIEYDNGDDNTMIVPKNVLIATGSKPKTLPGLDIDGSTVMSSTEALNMKTLPTSILIVGGGVIGIEWASMLADFGVKVTVLEYADHILPTEDITISQAAQKQLEKKGIMFITSANLLADSLTKDDGVTISAEVNNEQQTFTAEKMLVSVGRNANRQNIGLENTDIRVENDAIQVNDYYQTHESHIYAIGDVIGGMQLAHVASHEGIVAVEHMAGQEPLPIDYDSIPSCIYASPAMTRVGLTEKVAKKKNLEIKVGTIPCQANVNALIHGEIEAFVKVIADKQTDDIIGIHMIGPQVPDMISEAGLAKVLDATPWEMTQNIYPHPTLSEVIGEAALAVDGNQIHG